MVIGGCRLTTDWRGARYLGPKWILTFPEGVSILRIGCFMHTLCTGDPSVRYLEVARRLGLVLVTDLALLFVVAGVEVP